MNLSPTGSGYRGMALRCPGCAEAMSPEVVGDAEVDVCTSCGGIWVDWFDGELRKVARKVLASEADRASRLSAPSALSERVATGACPRCLRQLVAERYVVHAPEGDQPTGATLLRCEECAGAYVSRDSAELLATLPANEPPPPSVDGEASVLTTSRWQAFAGLLKRLRGG